FDFLLSALLLITVYPLLILLSKVFKVKLSKHFSKLLLLPEVFKGEYSFVGYPVWHDTGGSNFTGKKGLTGLIQLNYNENISEEEMQNLNLYYAKNQSLSLDTEILLKTFISSFKK
ncbi:MAG: sugar transferase, partial [bacterium]|nr:sugar transferase [bacterium]